jgi:gluconolactonase
MNSSHFRSFAALLLGALLFGCGGGGSSSKPVTTRYALTVSKSGTGSGTVTGSGISCGDTCTATYASGTSVTLTAAPADGSTFSGWSGACTGTGTCTVAMTAARAVTAAFAAAPPPGYYALTVSKSGTGSGTVSGTSIACGDTCTANYASGTVVTLTATPADGSTFSGWGGACSGTGACTVTLSETRAVTATFAAQVTPPSSYLVAMVQSSKTKASDLSADDVAALVQDAVAKAGGLDFIHDGQTVVLKPNLLTAYSDGGMTQADLTVNGIDTDWRVTKAVADLVRAKNPSGKILVMEGSVNRTTTAFSLLGYTAANFGTAVDEFIALEGSSCNDTSTTALVQKAGVSGKLYWINSRYVNADVLIDLPVMKTHVSAGITGAVKNLGIGTTPVGKYSSTSKGSSDCTRGQTASYIDHSTPETLGAFIRDFYSLRPPDFVVMDALQGLENGPLPVWGGGEYSSSKKNMRLILAAKNAVALDTIAAQVMMCDPRKVPHLTLLEADGLGTTDAAKITVVGKQVTEVATPFAGKQTAICPGHALTARPGGAACQAASYPAPDLTGSVRTLYKPTSAGSGTYEGPVWLPASSTLLLSDITFSGSVNPSQLLQSTAAGVVTSFLADAGTNGMTVDGNGVVFAASHKAQGIVRLNLADKTLTTVVSSYNGHKFNSPNDLVIRSDGTLYFTDPDFQLGSRTSETGTKGVYRVSPTGTVSLVDSTFTEPNGIALSPDESALYVADYNGNTIRKFTVAADGSTSGRVNFATVTTPDGFAVDCAGNLYVASGNSGNVQVFSPAGTKLGSVSVATGVSNLAFGGTDGKTLYITAGKALYALDMNLPGYSN